MKLIMKTFKKLTLLAVGLLVTFSAAAQVYTSKSSFVADLSSGYYLEDFSSLTSGAGPVLTLPFTGGAPPVSYVINAPPGGLFVTQPPDKAVGNFSSTDDIIVTFNSGNVHTVGADFFLNNLSGVRQAGSISISFSDGTTAVVPSFESGAYGFFGMSSGSVITSLTIANDGVNGNFINVANLYVSSVAVPEPSAAVLLVLGGTLLSLRRKRA